MADSKLKENTEQVKYKGRFWSSVWLFWIWIVWCRYSLFCWKRFLCDLPQVVRLPCNVSSL